MEWFPDGCSLSSCRSVLSNKLLVVLEVEVPLFLMLVLEGFLLSPLYYAMQCLHYTVLSVTICGLYLTLTTYIVYLVLLSFASSFQKHSIVLLYYILAIIKQATGRGVGKLWQKNLEMSKSGNDQNSILLLCCREKCNFDEGSTFLDMPQLLTICKISLKSQRWINLL